MKTVYECELSYLAEAGLKNSQYKGNLGNWVEHQRQSKKGKGVKLFPEREELLQVKSCDLIHYIVISYL